MSSWTRRRRSGWRTWRWRPAAVGGLPGLYPELRFRAVRTRPPAWCARWTVTWSSTPSSASPVCPPRWPPWVGPSAGSGEQGEPGQRRVFRYRPRRPAGSGDPAGGLRALRSLPTAGGRGAGAVASLVTGVRGSFPRPLRRRPGGRHTGRRAGTPHLADGREDHDRLGHADEQGVGGHRSAPSLRRVVRSDRGGGAPAVVGARAGAAGRRRPSGSSGHAGHARAHRLRAPSPPPVARATAPLDLAAVDAGL